MTCANCGTTNPAGQRFCGECGSPLASVCSSCGTSNPPGQRFCGNCGSALQAGGAAARAPGTPGATGAAAGSAAPAGAAGPGVGDGGPIAERRLVSVLFADLVGFTPFAEERDAEDTREMLTRYSDLSREVIGRYGGVVEKFIGDAVMAVWGAPTAREDDAERAVRAALELVDAVPGLGPGIQARAGVLTGEAAVNVGATNQGLVVGDIVNTAARLQSAAPAGAVLVGEATMRAASAAIAFQAAGEQVLKGKTAPVPSWLALRVVAQRGGQGRSDLPEPPFTGRDEELRLLKEVIATTGRDRRTRLVSITGPAGIGKSRLAWELEKYIDGISETIFWHRGRSPSYGEGITFWALGEMVRRRAGLSEGDDEATTRSRIAETVATYVPSDEDRRWVEPALLTLLGLEPAPAGGRDVLFAAWRIFFERIAARATTIMLFEDLHWADSGLLDFIEHTLEWARGVPLIVVTLARPELFERRPDWGAATRNLTKVALEPLPDEAMRRLLDGFVPGLPEAAVTTILRRADGIPLYAVETVRALVAEGRLAREGDVYRPVGDLRDLAIPETLRSLIASRLDALDAVDRSLVSDAAVLGQSFTLAGLASISGQPSDALEARLRGLVRRELFDLEIDPRSPERGQYRFVQSLIREVAYGTLARRERRARHLAAARYFEASGDDELAGLLASHYLAAHEASTEGAEAEAIAIQARIALSGAAERAVTLGAHGQALTYLRQAIAITTDDAEKVALLLRAAASAAISGDFEAAQACADEAATLATARGDAGAVVRAQALVGEILIDRGLPIEAVAALEAAVTTTPADADAEAQAGLLANLSRAQMRAGNPTAAIETADRALVIAERLSLYRILAETFNNKGSSLSYLGRTNEAQALLRAAVQLAHDHGYVSAEIRAMSNLSSSTPAVREARETARGAASLARRVGNRTLALWAGTNARYADYFMADRWDEALAEAAEDRVSTALTPLDEIRNLSTASLKLVPRGLPTDEVLARLRVLSAETSDPFGRTAIHFLLGDRAFVAGDYATAADEILAAAQDRNVTAGFLPLALRAAAWGDDLPRARRIAADLEARNEGDPATEAGRAGVRASLLALEGRMEEATTAYRDAIDEFEALGQDFLTALTCLDFVRLVGPGAPGAREAAERARAIFERVDARPYLERLEAAVAAPPRGSRAASPTEASPERR